MAFEELHLRLDAASYRFAFEGLQTKTLTLDKQSLLNWSNPERATFNGAVFLWTCAGRPELIANAYGRGPWLRHEFHSLSTEPMIAERDGSRMHRFQPGIQWRDLADGPEPAASRPLRLAQMRRQAERFRATVFVQKSMGEKEPAELRLLTQPVYRSPESAAEDVALFLFVQGTDPECVLMLEATANKSWRYALARQTRAALQANLDGKQVLDVPTYLPQAPEPDSAFLVVTPPEAREGQ
jgi:hypothetical protein